MKVCHVTSVHRRYDGRIFQKECTSLAKKYDVSLLCVDDKEDEIVNNVKIFHQNIVYKGKFDRIFHSSNKLLERVLEINADVYHLHDPELMLLGKKLIKKGKLVIFDSHEDYPGVIISKTWIPKLLRKVITWLYKGFEKRTLRKFNAVITATPHVQERLVKINKNTFMVTNFPILYDVKKESFDNYLCFAGGLTPQWSHKEIIESLKDINTKYKIAGKKDEKYFQVLENLDNYKKVEYLGFLNKDEVQELYAHASIGMAICKESANVNWHQGNLANTKLFEYMAAGVPVICSDFVLWKKIVEEDNCGIAVDINNIDEINAAIKKLIGNKKLLQEMSKNGIKAAKEKYNWNSQEKQLYKVYNCVEKYIKNTK